MSSFAEGGKSAGPADRPSFPLRIDLNPSPLLACLLVAAHGLALAAVWASLSGWLLGAAAAAIALSAAVSLAGCLHRSATAATSVELQEDGRAAWRDRREIWHAAELGRRHFVSAGLVIMELGGPEGRKSLVILADSAPSEDLRRLRAWLRWRGDPK